VSKPLAGIKVVEVAMWAFVPVSGAMLADLGASVLKIEAHEGDPMRALTTGGSSHSWELYNRGKRSIALDLKAEGAVEVLHKLLEDADVFLTSLLPAARRRLGIDVDDIRARHPKIIYAVGSALGPKGPELEKGGYDFITFWCRGGVAAGVTPLSEPFPLTMPSGAFGDCTSGSMLAGGVCAALLKRERTGETSVVDVSLLGASMWVMQRNITAASAAGIDDLPKKDRREGLNPLVNTYRTADDRFLTLCMIQSDRWWEGFCRALDEPRVRDDPRFVTHDDRAKNYLACVELLDEVFAGKPLSDWREILATQPGPWDAVQFAGEMKDDVQVQANGYLQDVDCGGHALKMVSVPIQFDRHSMTAQAAPAVGAHSDQILAEAGYTEDQILDLKVAGVIW
jgi:crotonobetainyl-CoA:carnitine CoA-transferase CaiB-like acyl-CoA transferase